jgi:hypothetical protein
MIGAMPLHPQTATILATLEQLGAPAIESQ